MNANVHKIIKDRLAEYFGSRVRIESFARVGGGCINQSTRVHTSAGVFFVKWNNHGPEDLFLREAESLDALRNTDSGLVIPEVIYSSEILTSLPGVIIMEFLEASHIGQFSADEQFGRGLAQLHKSIRDNFGFLHDNYCGSTLQNNQWNHNWAEFFGQQRIWHLIQKIEQERGIHAQDKELYANLVDKLPNILSHSPKPSLTHGDLWSGNYMYTDKGPALIDPASYYADRECDLALMRMFGGFSDRVWSAYQEAYPLESNWKDRSEIYQLFHYLNHYLIFGGHYYSNSLRIARSYT